MSPIEERLHDLLAQAGVELVETGKLDARCNACYHQATRTIIVRTGLDPAPAREPSATGSATRPTVTTAPTPAPSD